MQWKSVLLAVYFLDSNWYWINVTLVYWINAVPVYNLPVIIAQLSSNIYWYSREMSESLYVSIVVCMFDYTKSPFQEKFIQVFSQVPNIPAKTVDFSPIQKIWNPYFLNPYLLISEKFVIVTINVIIFIKVFIEH